MNYERNDPNLRNAYKPVPDAFADTVLQTVRSVREDHPVREDATVFGIRRKIAVPLLAAILILAMAVAYAVTRPAILDRFLPPDMDNPALTEIAHDVVSENTADGITARITGIIFDGERFAFTYEVENSDPTLPAMIVVDGPVLVNGREEGLESTDAGTADPQIVPTPCLDILPVRRNPVDGYCWSLPLSQPLTGDVTCEIGFRVYRPVRSFVYVREEDSWISTLDEYEPDQQAEILDAWETLKSFRNVIVTESDTPDAESWFRDGYTVIDFEGRIDWNDDNPYLYNMQETARIPVTFHFDAGAPTVCDYSDTADIVLEDCTLHVDKARFSPFSTVIDISVIPSANTEEAAQALLERYGSWYLADQDGNAIPLSLWEGAMHFEPCQEIRNGWNGRSHWALVLTTNQFGLDPWPDSVSLVTEAGELIRFDLKSQARTSD